MFPTRYTLHTPATGSMHSPACFPTPRRLNHPSSASPVDSATLTALTDVQQYFDERIRQILGDTNDVMGEAS
eukprot:scaffold17914_cov81-Cyclotella_meneghiniana.AAC.4